MVYRISAGLFFLFTGFIAVGVPLPVLFIGVLAIIAGIALLAGL